MIWTQNYDPLGAPLLSTLVAAVPIILLLGLLATGRVPAPLAALIALIGAVLIAMLVFTPPEVAERGREPWVQAVLAAAGHGAAFGLFPIGWIVLAAIFLYSLTVETGQFEIVKHSVISLSSDRRIQALLIAFCFGAFVEGAAGFGTPVAISAALLVGAGFKPIYAACLALIANTSPVAFGALGTPTTTLASVTGLDLMQLSKMAGRQLPFFSFIVPIWLVTTMAGWRGALAIWPALLVCGGSFAIVQFAVANYHGPWLVDVAGGIVSMVCLALFLKVWQPRDTFHFADEEPAKPDATTYTGRQIASAWVPWMLLTVFVFLWGLPQVKDVLGSPSKAFEESFEAREEAAWLGPTMVSVKTPGLHRQIARTTEVVAVPDREKAIFHFNWLSATGSGIFLAAVVSAMWLRISPARFLSVLAATCYRMRWPLFTIACMLAIAFTTRYSGVDATLGLAFTRTGWIYPLFAALLGWVGVALTGSDTSANALFGSLQTITASKLVEGNVLPLTVPQASVLLASANSSGGVMGKMIDAQSIVVSAAATGQHGQEGAILRFVFWHSLVLAVLMGLLVMAQAYWWSWMIP
ncbi:MAG: lactate permease LctP family transporter [Gemmataceae bacterium]|nr:lactate permease LctP family transporter [Gemmataceae bacterium]